MRSRFLPEGRLLHTSENEAACASCDGLRRAMEEGTVLEGVAQLCDGAHNLLEQVCRRLLPGGRLVVSCILLDTLARCRAFFESLGWPAEVMQIQSAQSRPLGQDIFLAAANPVFLLAVDKPEQEKDED